MLRSPIRHVVMISVLAVPLLAPGARDVLPVVTEAHAAGASWEEYLAARAAFKTEVEGYWIRSRTSGAGATPSGANISRSRSTTMC
jgi:hypothetical protein